MKKLWKRTLALLVALMIGIAAQTGVLAAGEAPTALSGTCGENLTWTLENGTLTVSGTGEMDTYFADGFVYYPENVPSVVPWQDIREQIRSIVIEEGVATIGNGAFEYCQNVGSVTLPDSLTSIGNSAFAFCENLCSIQIPQNVTKIGMYAFRRCGQVFVDAKNPAYTGGEDGVLLSHTQLLHYPVNLQQTSYTIPSGVRRVEEYAFHGCRYLQSLTIPASVENMGFAFYCCTSLQNVIVEKGVKVISAEAFYGCENLRSVTLPDGLEKIGFYAFMCTALDHLHIPGSVTQIDDWIMFSSDYRKDDTEFPYLQSFYICSDTENCAAKTYAEKNHFRFYVCSGKHDEKTVRYYNSPIKMLLYVLRDEDRVTTLLSAVIAYAGSLLKQCAVPQSIAG